MPHKLLIIDDSRGCADMYRMRFERDNWEVKIAYSAEAAIELFKTDYWPDIVFLDIMLPKMQGDELLDLFRKDERLKHLKVIVLTALNLASGDETKLSEKADDYILKIDVNPKDLVRRATELLEKDNIADS